jgi:chromosome segregation ATPase
MKITIKFGIDTITILSFIVFVICLISSILSFSIAGICGSVGFGLYVALYHKLYNGLRKKSVAIDELSETNNDLTAKLKDALKKLSKAESNFIKMDSSIKFEHSNNAILKDEIEQYKSKLSDSLEMINTLSNKAKTLKESNDKLSEERSALLDTVATLYSHIKSTGDTIITDTDSNQYVEKSIIVEDSSTYNDENAVNTSASTIDNEVSDKVDEKPKKSSKRKKASKK